MDGPLPMLKLILRFYKQVLTILWYTVKETMVRKNEFLKQELNFCTGKNEKSHAMSSHLSCVATENGQLVFVVYFVHIREVSISIKHLQQKEHVSPLCYTFNTPDAQKYSPP